MYIYIYARKKEGEYINNSASRLRVLSNPVSGGCVTRSVQDRGGGSVSSCEDVGCFCCGLE